MPRATQPKIMRVVPLTPAVQEKVLGSRRDSSREAERIASRIVEDVRRRGDTSLFAYTKRFDRVSLSAKNVWISRAELEKAQREVPADFLAAIDHAARNIRAVAKKQKPLEWDIEVEPGVRAGQRVRPIDSIGCYLPGGRFSLVSTLLMTVVPAQQAGVREIIVVSPQPGPALLAAAERLGVEKVARIGGAQAIAALAYGTRSIPRVDKIFGPGNRFVTAAKRLVSADCAIDMLAGPTEAIVFADRGNPQFIAADLIAQAEHDPDAISIFVTTSARLGKAVAAEVDAQLAQLPASNLARRSLTSNGAVLVARNLTEAIRFVNLFAPEHLSLPDSSSALLDRINSAGSIFLGAWSAQTFGDYASGTNHVLPTGGVARTRGGLSVTDFVKCISVQEVSQGGFARLAPVAAEFARAEGLDAHARSVTVRQ
ncbi:MAG TPA: histidinol dehydrogenase [Candidatus Acidoferrales bacterium]|jgi:histidinol dehydrogenase|nr:histidinol dehydrogenase [Candidatus Acidoferrales bacterium]